MIHPARVPCPGAAASPTPAAGRCADPIYTEARVEYRLIGLAELLATRDWLRAAVADAEDHPDGGVALRLPGERLRAADDEWARRPRQHAAGKDVPDPRDRRYEAWRDLARRVRREADILRVFAEGGYHLDRTGRHEWHGWCFVCRDGRDRLLVRTDPPGRYWCRRCGITGDAIHAARNLLGPVPGVPLGFFAAVSRLARQVGLPVPDDERLLRGAPAPTRRRIVNVPEGCGHAR